MMSFQRLAERRILQAMQEGEFDNLPGRGRPLDLDDDAHLPEELRLAYRILKNAGFAPPEVELRREIARIEELIGSMDDAREKYRQVKKLNFLVMKLNMLRKTPLQLEKHQRYEQKLTERFGAR